MFGNLTQQFNFSQGRNNSGWIIYQDDWNVSQIYTKYGKFVSLFVGNTEFSI